MDDLEVPPIIDIDEGHGGKAISENESNLEEGNDYVAFNMKDFFR